MRRPLLFSFVDIQIGNIRLGPFDARRKDSFTPDKGSGEEMWIGKSAAQTRQLPERPVRFGENANQIIAER